jgi:hypothetical protein
MNKGEEDFKFVNRRIKHDYIFKKDKLTKSTVYILQLQ